MAWNTRRGRRWFIERFGEAAKLVQTMCILAALQVSTVPPQQKGTEANKPKAAPAALVPSYQPQASILPQHINLLDKGHK